MNEERKIAAIKAVVGQLNDAHKWAREQEPDGPKRDRIVGEVKAYTTVLKLLDMDLESICKLIYDREWK